MGSVFGVITSAAAILNFALARGVAIAKVDNEFVWYFVFSRQRVASQPHLMITATLHEVDVPDYTGATWLKLPQVLVQQVTLRRPGQPDVNFRTALLRDKADVIASRMSALTR